MIKLPKSTAFNKKIPKQKFYENLNVSDKLKRAFIEDIKSVYWTNKISEDTINIKSGIEVKEIQIFLIELKGKEIDENLLMQIDSHIPYHIVFILNYLDKYKLAIGYKEEALAGNKAFKVSSYYYSDWIEKENISLNLRGLNLDRVYENLLKDIRGRELEPVENETMADLVEKDIKIEELKKDIEKLKINRRKSKQLNKQMKINDQIRTLKNEIEKLMGEA